MWEEKRSGERGLLEESAHGLGVPGLGFKCYPDVYANGCFVFQIPPSALKGGFWDWEKVVFAWVSAPWVLLGG